MCSRVFKPLRVSVLESVAAGVPLVAWPIEFEQPVNAKFIVDELGIGVRVHSSDRTIRGLVKSNEITRVVRELMFGEDGMAMASKAAKLARQAQLAVSEVGSSWKAIEDMIREALCDEQSKEISGWVSCVRDMVNRLHCAIENHLGTNKILCVDHG